MFGNLAPNDAEAYQRGYDEATNQSLFVLAALMNRLGIDEVELTVAEMMAIDLQEFYFNYIGDGVKMGKRKAETRHV